MNNNAQSAPPFNGSGGGIFNHAGSTLTVMNSTISNNSSNGTGGGINTFAGTLTVTNSVISGNSAISGNSSGAGGGIGYESSLTVRVTNSTIGGNSADGGGGIWNDSGRLTVTNSTISANSAPTGGGILNAGTAEIGDTILNAGASGGTISIASGTVTSLGYNLASDNGGGVLTGPGDQINTDPMLGPLQDNGGRTFTHALLPGSPAIDAGDPNFTPPPFDDQRGPGSARVVNNRIDIGSFEAPRAAQTPRPRPTPHPRP